MKQKTRMLDGRGAANSWTCRLRTPRRSSATCSKSGWAKVADTARAYARRVARREAGGSGRRGGSSGSSTCAAIELSFLNHMLMHHERNFADLIIQKLN